VTATLPRALLDALAAIVGSSHVLTGSEVSSRQAGGLKPTPLAAGALVRPADTVETSAVMKLCYSQGVAVVPSGGNTGLVGGTQAGPSEIALSVERMRNVESVDISNRAMTVGSGVVLEQAQEAAAADGLLFPVDLGARGTAMIGGLIATNAGGNGVLR
jgi:FAD/FMN-containing dehydrogenase